jgi:hypothetical protein
MKIANASLLALPALSACPVECRSNPVKKFVRCSENCHYVKIGGNCGSGVNGGINIINPPVFYDLNSTILKVFLKPTMLQQIP